MECNRTDVDYLVDRVFDAIDDDPGLYEVFQEATFVEIKEHNPEAYEDWSRGVEAEANGEMSTDSFDQFQNKFFDLVVDPYKNALMTKVFALCIQKMVATRVVQMAEATGYAT